MDLNDVERVVFCADGSAWIWSGVEALCARLQLEPIRVRQVLDYTHAKQNLQEVLDLVPGKIKAGQANLAEAWKGLVWQGRIGALRHAIAQTITSRSRRQRALNKWQNYFARHQSRMQYQAFQQLPCGSGCVESAIRRVINLRLKAPGSFWTRAMAECFLCLRAQLLSGRWEILLNNLTRQTARRLINQAFDDSPLRLGPLAQGGLKADQQTMPFNGNAPCSTKSFKKSVCRRLMSMISKG